MQPVYKNPNTPTIEQVYRTNLIIWFAMLMAQVMFFLPSFFAKPELFKFAELWNSSTEINPVIWILAVMAIVVFALSFVIKSRFLRLAIENRSVQAVNTAQIVAYALSEAITLFGLLTAFAFNFRFFFLFFALGILALVLHFPRRENFNAAAFKGIH